MIQCVVMTALNSAVTVLRTVYRRTGTKANMRQVEHNAETSKQWSDVSHVKYALDLG